MLSVAGPRYGSCEALPREDELEAVDLYAPWTLYFVSTRGYIFYNIPW